MRLRPDDEIRRARLIYLGPGRNALPMQWPYAKWALYGLTVLILAGLLYPIFRTVLVLPLALAVALFPTSFIFDRVNPDQPARKVVVRLLRDWRADRDRGQPTELPTPTAGHIRLSRSTTEEDRP